MRVGNNYSGPQRIFKPGTTQGHGAEIPLQMDLNGHRIDERGHCEYCGAPNGRRHWALPGERCPNSPREATS